MKTIRDFLEFTNIKGARIRYSALLIFASILYCMFYSLCMLLIYSTEMSLAYYLGSYLLSIVTTFFYMIILFQFIYLKREEVRKLKYREYIVPLIVTQSIYYIILAGGGIISYSAFQSETMAMWYTPITIILMLCIFLYLPMQIFSFYTIYDGAKNPFKIIGRAFMTIIRHYQSVFYSLFVMLVIAAIFSIFMSTVYGYTSEFVPFVTAMDIMLRNNPFLMASELLPALFSNSALWLPVLISIVYGVIVCICSVYYFMIMACIFDNDIRI